MSKRIVIFSGAGLSAESGVPTFRDADGLWENHRIEDVASPQGWRRDPALVLEFYARRFLAMGQCRPNPAHEAIVRLAGHHEVVCITQNIDTLLEQAGMADVWHLHGRIDVQKCEWHHSCAFAEDDPRYTCRYASTTERPIALGDRCPVCGGQLRPDVVWFGEPVDMRPEYLQDLIATTDTFIGVGTSAQVYPAAGLLQLFAHVPERYFIDPHPAYEALTGYEVLQGPAAVHLPALVERLI